MRRYLLSLIAVGLWPTLTFAQTGTQVVEYYHTDALGSVRAVTKVVNGQTQVVSRHDFMPFGEEVGPQTPPVDKRLFTGKERDAETGLDYFGARYLRADLGRFTSPDLPGADQHPTDPQSWGLYVYVRNNPLRRVDPGGRTASAVLPSGDDANPSPDPQGNKTLPGNPNELGPEWKEVTPRKPDGTSYGEKVPRRFRNPNGVEVEFDPKQPGFAPDTHRGKGHWHQWDPAKGRRVKDITEPGDPVPAPISRMTGVVVTTVGLGVAAYAGYRVVRLLPSLVPPLWPTLPFNVILP